MTPLTGRQILTGQARIATRRPPSCPSPRPWMLQDLGLVQPAGRIAGNLAHKVLAQLTQAVQELLAPAVELIERPGRHPNPVDHRATNLLQRDLRLGAQGHAPRTPRL